MSDQTVKLAAPDDVSFASWNGQEFAVEDGLVTVPSEAADALAEHGFTVPKAKKAGKSGEGA